MVTPTPNRAAKWLVATMGGAALAMAADMTMMWLHSSRNPNDLAYGRPLLLALLDPFILTLAGPIAAVSGLAAYVVAYFWLDTTVLWKTATLTCTAEYGRLGTNRFVDPIAALAFLAAALWLGTWIPVRVWRDADRKIDDEELA